MKDMNEIPADSLKVALAALNKVLDVKIKTIGKKKSDVCEAFKNAVATFIEEDTADQLPDEVVDFYNDYIADEEVEEEKEEKSSKKPAGKDSKKTPPGKGVKNTDGKPAGKDSKKPAGKDVKKNPSGRTPSDKNREKTIVLALKKGGTKEELIDMSDEFYVKAGGTSNKNQAKKLLDRGLKYFQAADLLTVKNGKYSL